MTCADFEVLLADYVDGTLDAARRTELEAHQRQCSACAEFARDVAGAVAFLERVPEVEPPPELLAKIAFEIPAENTTVKGLRTWMMGWLQPLIQPRFAMGMAMTILSFSMLGRFSGIEVRQLKPSDLQPAKVWAAVDDRANRAWGRAVKYYENLRLVYEVQTRLQEWSDQDEKRQAGEGKEKK
jgi:anti-sigma factor RsiW